MNRIKSKMIKKMKRRRNLTDQALLGLTVLLVIAFFFMGFSVNKSSKSEPSYKRDPQNINMSFVGDIMPGRYVATQASRYGLADLMHDAIIEWQSSDLKIANLETSVLYDDRDYVRNPLKEINISSSYQLVNELADLGLNVVSLANNHVLDYGYQGLNDTRKILEDKEILYMGIGNNTRDLLDFIEVVEVDGKSITFLAFSEILPRGFTARDNRPGVLANINDQVIDLIRMLSKQTDFMVVLPHWGVEYATSIANHERELAHQLVDAGADIVIGSHPHVLQPLEIYNDKLIAYSMGNFLFDQTNNTTRTTAMGHLALKNDGTYEVAFIPFDIKNAKVVEAKSGYAKRLAHQLLLGELESSQYELDGHIIKIGGLKYGR